MKTETSTPGAGPWNEVALEQLLQWGPAWAQACQKMTANPWQGVVACNLGVSILAEELTRTATMPPDSQT